MPQVNENTSQTGKRSVSLFSKILSILLSLISCLFIFFLYRLNILPDIFLIPLVVIIVLFALMTVLLLCSRGKPARLILGVVLSIALLAVFGAGSFYLGRALSTADTVMTESPETVTLGRYVRASGSDSGSGALGTVRGFSGTVLRAYPAYVNRDLIEYASLSELVTALDAGEIEVAVIPEYQLELLSGFSGFEDLDSRLSRLDTAECELDETDVPSPPPAAQTAAVPDNSSAPAEEIPVAADNPNVFSVYISGIDTYGPVSTLSRSDVNILVVVNTETHQILLLSTPRDYYVRTTVSGEYRDKLTHAGLYGIACSSGTIAELYDCDIDYYFRVNFSGFTNIINALGGVEVYSEYTGQTYFFYGEEALDFVRSRNYSDGDRQRGKDQMYLIKGVIKKMLSPALLTGFNDILDSVEGNFETSVPYDLLSGLVKEQLASNPSWDIVQYSVTGGNTNQVPWTYLNIYGGPVTAYCMEPDTGTVETASELIAAMERDGRISTPSDYKK